MANPRIHDEAFGVLEWDRIEGGWARWIGHPVLETWGTRILRDEVEAVEPATPPEDLTPPITSEQFEQMIHEGPLSDMVRAFSEEMPGAAEKMVETFRKQVADRNAPESPLPKPEKRAFEFIVSPSEYGAEPTAAQRAAWQQFQENDASICTRIVQLAQEAYHRQRAARVHWWRELYGDDALLKEVLPEKMSAGELPRYIRPLVFQVHRQWPDAGEPVVGIRFEAAWDDWGFGVVVRGGRVQSLGDREIATKAWIPKESIEHPVFGTLINGEGVFRWEPLRQFYEIAEEREMIRTGKPTRQRGFFPPWRFLEGQFDLDLCGTEDSPEVAEEFRRFTADPQHSADQVLEAIFAYYQEMTTSYREYLEPEDADVIMPQIDSVNGLRPLLTFQKLRVFTHDQEDGPCIGLGFHCSWEQEHGLGVRWRAGKVEEVGAGEVSFQ